LLITAGTLQIRVHRRSVVVSEEWALCLCGDAVFISLREPRVMYRVGIIVGALLALTTAVVVRPNLVNLDQIDGPTGGVEKTPLSPNRQLPRLPTGSAEKIDVPRLTFDVVRIDPQGSSVFAGQAPPNSSVSILANGQALATAAADETGAWAIVTDRKIAAGEHEISLGAVSSQGGVTAGEKVQIVVAPPAAAGSATPEPPARSPPSSPAPITFVYNDTTFTTDGRRAAEVLAKHLLSQQPAVVSLSGHADERGTDVYNIELSRRRLLVVADYLREHGFVGKLELIPKGKSEPYTGVDRWSLPREDAFQLDRRVELHRPRR
jgi:outer membrane protein OmpA-like peptidoglycan-associated protein